MFVKAMFIRAMSIRAMIIDYPSRAMSLILMALLSLSCLNVSADESILDYFFDDIGFADQESERRFQQLQASMRGNEIEQAVLLAEELVDKHIELSEDHPIRFGKLLSNLGVLLSYQGFFQDAMTSLDASLAFIEQKANPFSNTILTVTMARGVTQTELKLFEAAEESFRRAQHISHRNGGVYNPEQLEIIDHLTKLNLKQRLYSDADREQNFNLRISEQAYGKNSEEIIPILDRLGRYFATRGNMIPMAASVADYRYYRDSLFRQSLDMYNRAITIVEDNHGVNDIRLVELLRGIARTRLLQFTNRSASEAALERALSIVESNPDADVTDRVKAMIYLADMYTITGDGRAREVYLKAWASMDKDSAYDELQAEIFGTPTRLYPEMTGILYLKRKPDAVTTQDIELFIDVSYSVKATGRVGDIQLVDKNVPNEQFRYMRSQLAETRFRPRILDGELVSTENLMIHQTFRVIDDRPVKSDI
jgi:tetratricopeptide (TPR) repeat protein